MTEDGYERMERKSLLAGTPQEVIITICKGELRAGGLREVGIPSVCFGTRMKHYITQPDYMWRARMHKCREMNTHTHTEADFHWASGCCREFPEERRALGCCYMRLCCLIQRSLIAKKSLREGL